MNLLIFLSLLLSCKGSNNDNNKELLENGKNVVSTQIIEDLDVSNEPIDTTEFVSYWRNFRQSILKHDTTTLSSMIDDGVRGGWFLNREDRSDPMPKSIFLQKIDSLFTSDYLSVLAAYDIKNDLFSNLKIETNKDLYIIKNYHKTYFASIYFYDKTYAEYLRNIVCYSMGFDTDEDYYPDKFIKIGKESIPIYKESFELRFKNTLSGIKLYYLGCSYNFSISE